MSEGENIGEVIHYFGKISVAVLMLKKTLRVGTQVHFLGRHTDFPEEITSMQIDHQPVTEAKAGAEVAVKVSQKVRKGDAVLSIGDET